MRTLSRGVFATLCCLLSLCCLPVQAGTLRNLDRQVYTYAVHWDDLEPATRGEIKPNETVTFRNATGYIELVGKRDSIYMRHDEAILIQGAILRSPTHPIED